MTNIESLALEISRMKHRRKIMCALPMFLEVRIKHSGNSEEESLILKGDVAVFPDPAHALQHVG